MCYCMDTMTIEDALGYFFSDKELLDRALTHNSYANEQNQQGQNCEDQGIYCTLGDAVLKTVLAHLLIKSGCKTKDEITSKKKEFEREEKLAEIGRELGIGSFIKLGVGAKRHNLDKEPKVLAETVEALIGAIYLDGGYEASKEVITKWFKGKDIKMHYPSLQGGKVYEDS